MGQRLVFAVPMILVLASVAQAGPPAAAVQSFKEVLHGVEIVDPYRWLEGSAGLETGKPDPALDARVSAWTDAQNAYTRSRLDGLPRRREIEARLRKLESGGGFRWGVTVRGDRTFYQQIAAGQQQPVLMALDTSKKGGEPRVLVDPVTVDPSGLTTLAWFEPGPDGKLVAFGLFKAGDENATLYLLETADFTTLERAVGPQLATSLRDLTLGLYSAGAAHAATRDLILAGTKFELGHAPGTGELLLIDEVLTPDSSRYWDVAHWAPGEEPVSFDKQFVRNWLDESGWDKESPPPELPQDVVQGTLDRYVEAFRRITGREPEL